MGSLAEYFVVGKMGRPCQLCADWAAFFVQ